MKTKYHPKEWLLRMLQINPGLFSLFSGMSIASAINFYTGIFSADQLPNKWLILLSASLLMLVASICWAVLYWKLDALRALERSSGQRITWDKLIAPKFKSVTSYLVCGICATVAGLGILPLSIINRQAASTNQAVETPTTVGSSPNTQATAQPTPTKAEATPSK